MRIYSQYDWQATAPTSSRAVYLKDLNGADQLYIRRGNSTVAYRPKRRLNIRKLGGRIEEIMAEVIRIAPKEGQVSISDLHDRGCKTK